MYCSGLPVKYAALWTIWKRTNRKRHFWQLYGAGPNQESDERNAQAAARGGEVVVLPPGEVPLMARDRCHRGR